LIFEVKKRDAFGRMGEISFRDRKLETPAFIPVVHPFEKVPKYIAKNFEAIITNAYILYSNVEEREKAEKKGIHRYMGFDGVIFTDSGSYQIFENKAEKIDNLKIIMFENRIGVDAGAFVDIPTDFSESYDKASEDLKKTFEHGREALNVSTVPILGTVQGGKFRELRNCSARYVARMGFEICAVGGLVHMMERYMFKDMFSLLYDVKDALPLSKPIHLFGCGHPMVLSLAVFLGFDTFDSASYEIYANNGRYITERGTRRIEEMKELPCECEICSNYSVNELKDKELLAQHNLFVIGKKMREIKEAISSGWLSELVERDSTSHPKLIDALRFIYRKKRLNYLVPVYKKSFIYVSDISLKRSDIHLFFERLYRRYSPKRRILILKKASKPYIGGETINLLKRFGEVHLSFLDFPFGIVPFELTSIYPVAQSVFPDIFSGYERRYMRKRVVRYLERFEEFYDEIYTLNFEMPGIERVEIECFSKKKGDPLKEMLISIADYQFGVGAGEVLFDRELRYIKGKYGRIRQVFDKNERVASLNAHSGFLSLSIYGANLLYKRFNGRYTVYVDPSVSEEIADGKNLFAKHVLSADKIIRVKDEVLIADDERLLANGKAKLSAKEMLEMMKGVAVNVREGVSDENK